MTTVAVPSGSATTLDSGSSAGLDIRNTGTVDVQVATGSAAASFGAGTHVLHPGQYGFVTTGNLPVLAQVTGPVAGQLSVTATAAPSSGSSARFPTYSGPLAFPGAPGNTTDSAPMLGSALWDASSGRLLQYHPTSGLWLAGPGERLAGARITTNTQIVTGASAAWTDVPGAGLSVPPGLPWRLSMGGELVIQQGTAAAGNVQFQFRWVDQLTANGQATPNVQYTFGWVEVDIQGTGGVIVEDYERSWPMDPLPAWASLKLQVLGSSTVNLGSCYLYDINGTQPAAWHMEAVAA